MMMAPPQVVGVLLKKPGQHNNPRAPPLDPQETKIRGELYVEDLNQRRIVSIRMGWLWVENTQMRLPLRALNLRQATPGICQPHVLALGFTLTNSQGDLLATFWADTEPIYWSWVRAIASELVRQTPFRAQRCLNFLEILTICPRGPIPLPESPTETRRRSRSELRCCWLGTASPNHEMAGGPTAAILESSRRRARSELRGWSSSNSSDEDLNIIDYNGITRGTFLPKVVTTSIERRVWGCSESSEGSDDSLPWGGVGCRSSVDSIDSPPTIIMPEPIVDTREQRMQRYKEVRRRENEARSRRVLEEDAKRRKARREERTNNNNNNNNQGNKNDLVVSRIVEANVNEEKSSKAKVTVSPATNSQTTTDEKQKMERSEKNKVEAVRNCESSKQPISSCQRLENSLTNGKPTESISSQSSTIPARTSRITTIKMSATITTPAPKLAPIITTATAQPTTDPFVRAAETVDAITRRLPPLKASTGTTNHVVRFKDNGGHREDTKNNNNNNTLNHQSNNSRGMNSKNRELTLRYKMESPPSPESGRTDSGERRSRARERRIIREKGQTSLLGPTLNDLGPRSFQLPDEDVARARLRLVGSRIPLISEISRVGLSSQSMDAALQPMADEIAQRDALRVTKDLRLKEISLSPRFTDSKLETQTADHRPLGSCDEEDAVAKLLARCQRVDHYVPVREKLTLFESLSRMGARLARSTEDLGRSATKSSPRGKQRARSLHDLNRAARTLPVREMCRLFEGERDSNQDDSVSTVNGHNLTDPTSNSLGKSSKIQAQNSPIKSHHQQDPPPCVRTSSRRKHYRK